jgi:hypothetical protein
MKTARTPKQKISNQRKGKSSEHQFYGMLLGQGFEVYIPLADDKGVDALVRLSSRKFAEVQIKGRWLDAQLSSTFAGITYIPGRPGYWFAFHTWDKGRDVWHLVTGKEFESIARQEKRGTWAISVKKNREALAHCVLSLKRWKQFSKG